MQAAPISTPVTPTLADLLPTLIAGAGLSRIQAAQLVDSILDGNPPDVQIAAALALLVAKGESPEELAGFSDALYSRSLAFPASADVLDTAGTGASPVKTFNVSSAAAFLIAASGCVIAKHGGRASTSRSGSADVLTALGVRIDCSPELSLRCLSELGICFLFAPKYHPALARVAPIRRSLGMRSSFNLVGPMVNPCRARYRLLGVADEARLGSVAGALAHLGVVRAWVLRGSDGLDEITTAGPTRILDVQSSGIHERTVSPADFGLAVQPTEPARAGSVEENAATVRAILSGQRRDVARDLAVINAAAALHVRTSESLLDCVARAQRAIDDGSALARLESLIALSQAGAL